MENKFTILIECDADMIRHIASGNMTSGNVKLIIGELELIKHKLLTDLEASLEP